MDKTYCARSHDCKNTECPKHLNGFNGQYISLAHFDCTTVAIYDGISKLIDEGENNVE